MENENEREGGGERKERKVEWDLSGRQRRAKEKEGKVGERKEEGRER